LSQNSPLSRKRRLGRHTDEGADELRHLATLLNRR
jgi:hypothetical protein